MTTEAEIMMAIVILDLVSRTFGAQLLLITEKSGALLALKLNLLKQRSV